MRGFGYAIGPVWYGQSGLEAQRSDDICAPRTARNGQPLSDESEMEFMLAVTLAIALVINIALTVRIFE